MAAEIPLQIRKASMPDLPLVLATDDMGTQERRRGFVRRAIEGGRCWLAESDGRVLGYVVADTSFFSYPFVWLLVVDREFRRRRVGTALMRHAESLFPGDKFFTSTNESNLQSQALMESLGFVRSGRIENLDEGDPEIVYFLTRGRHDA